MRCIPTGQHQHPLSGFELLGTQDRLRLLRMGLFLLEDWPYTFIDFCINYRIGRSALQPCYDKTPAAQLFSTTVWKYLQRRSTLDTLMPRAISEHVRTRLTQNNLLSGKPRTYFTVKQQKIVSKRSFRLYQALNKLLQRRSQMADVAAIFHVVNQRNSVCVKATA